QYLRPDTVRFERLAPFARFGPPAHEFGSYPLESNTPSTSLTATATLLFVLAVIGLVYMLRGRRRAPTICLAAVLFGTVVAAAPSLLIGFTANRYLTDLLPALLVPAAVTVTAVGAFQRRRAKQATASLVILAVAWGAWVNVALATWSENLKNPGFTAWRYELDAHLFGNPPPGVIELHSGATVPRDGIVAIDGACDGLYIAEQGHWVALERAAGRRQIRGAYTPTADTIVPAGDNMVLSGSPGTLRIDADIATGTATPVWQPLDGAAVGGTPVGWGGGPMAVEVVADPVAGGFAVSIDGRSALFQLEAPDLAELSPAAQFVVQRPSASTTPICNSLAARLAR
ncbi:MAG: hypothetical protein ABIQ39_09245, partial [Ilumatobacteraceae bacterium]